MSSKSTTKYKCLYCDKRFTRENLVTHIDEEHNEMIPEGFTAFRLVFNYVNKKPLDYHGRCTECGGPTDWDENKGRYNRQCNKPACKASYIKKFEENMIRTKGVARITSTVEGQEKMLANRKISGKYKFQNGVEKTYTGSYERSALEFMDKVMNCNPDDIMCPGPVLEYMFEGKKHIYITDIYYQPYNLVIEVKDGGSRPNNRSMPEYRAKQIAKEKFIINNTNYNYLRLTDNDLSQLLSIFATLKMQMIENSGERVININEAMNALTSGYIPGMKDSGSVYVVNYMKNNVFSGEKEYGYGVSDNIELTNLICRNKNGILSMAPDNLLQNAEYDVYRVDKSPREVSDLLSPKMDKFVDEGFIYRSLFGKELFSRDQICTEESAIPVMDFYKSLNYLSQITENYLLGKEYGIGFSESDDSFITFQDLYTGNYVIQSTKVPDIRLECTEKIDLKDSEERYMLENILLGFISK